MKNSKRRKIRGLEEWKIGNDNGELQGRDTRQRHSGLMTEEQTRRRIATVGQPLFTKPATLVCNDDTSVVMPECSCRAFRSLGFTLVELVIVIAIVIVLSVVSVPIYRSYVDKAKMAEGYALLGTILSAQKNYYSEHGNFLNTNVAGTTAFNTILGIDVRGNKYFTRFHAGDTDANPKTVFDARVWSKEFFANGKSVLRFYYNITSGGAFSEI